MNQENLQQESQWNRITVLIWISWGYLIWPLHHKVEEDQTKWSEVKYLIWAPLLQAGILHRKQTEWTWQILRIFYQNCLKYSSLNLISFITLKTYLLSWIFISYIILSHCLLNHSQSPCPQGNSVFLLTYFVLLRAGS
jgi:hypothetical protein